MLLLRLRLWLRLLPPKLLLKLALLLASALSARVGLLATLASQCSSSALAKAELRSSWLQEEEEEALQPSAAASCSCSLLGVCSAQSLRARAASRVHTSSLPSVSAAQGAA